MTKGALPNGLVIYKLDQQKGFKLDTTTLQEKLAEFAYSPISPDAISRFGFSAPLGAGAEELFYVAKDHGVVFTMTEESKVLPPDEVAKRMDNIVSEIQAKEGRLVRTKERKAIKYEVILEMLPYAFSKRTRHSVIYLEKLGIVAYLGDSTNAADKCLSLIRKALGSLPVIPMSVDGIDSRFVNLIKNGGAVVGSDALLRNISHPTDQVTFKNSDLEDNVIDLVDNDGYQIVMLELYLDCVCSLKLTTDFVVKGISWNELYKIKAENAYDELANSTYAQGDDDGDSGAKMLMLQRESDLFIMAGGVESVIKWLDASFVSVQPQ